MKNTMFGVYIIMKNSDGMKVKVWVLLVAALLLWKTSHSQPIETYVASVQSSKGIYAYREALPSFAAHARISPGEYQDVERLLNNEELLQRIEAEAVDSRIAPVNARVDRVWKAIPGLNGREVDVEATYQATAKLPLQSPIQYVYKEIEPDVSLKDLGAHPIYRGNPDKKMISLMINVAWGDEYLQKMLEVLAQEEVHATFFLDGSWLSRNLETARAIGAAGHELSNHAYSHKMMSRLSRSQSQQEIAKTEELLRQLDIDNKLFAPPAGDYSQQTVEIAHEMNLNTILWTIDTVDWKRPAPETVIERVTSKLEPGALILMHPTSSSSLALQAIIQEVKRQGYAIGTVSQLISPARLPEVETDHNK